MDGLLKGRVAIITGAGRETGIGRATAKVFLDHGAQVALCDLEAENPVKTAAALGENAMGIVCNVTEAAGRGYRVSDLGVVTQMATAAGFLSVLVLMLYFNQPTVLQQYSSPAILWGACLVLLYWIARMILMAQRGLMDDDPTVFAARDPISRAAFLIIFAAIALGASLP